MAEQDPRFTDQQMALILKRAAELQATGEEPVHTLAAIQEIARQVGIDAQLVADAAADLPAAGGRFGPRLLGAPSEFRVSRRIPGALQAADHPAVIATIRDHLPEVGEVQELAGGLEWHAGEDNNKTAITFTPSSGGTIVRIDGRYFGLKLILYLGAGAMTMLTGLLGMAGSPELGAGLGLGMFALSFASARYAWNRIAERGRRRLERLLAALTAQLADRTG
jgi:hypothetical protein